MPRGDGTGPRGMGPMTGRAAGYCSGFNAPGFANPAPRMGMGFRRGAGSQGRGAGFGRGRAQGAGFRRGFRSTAAPNLQRANIAPGNVSYNPQQAGQIPQAMNPFGNQVQPPQISQQAPQGTAQRQPQPTNPEVAQPQAIAQPSKEQEVQMLEEQLAALENQIGEIKSRINQLQG